MSAEENSIPKSKEARIARLKELRDEYSSISPTTREEYNRKSLLVKDALNLLKPVLDDHGRSIHETSEGSPVEKPIANRMESIWDLDAIINSDSFTAALPMDRQAMLSWGSKLLSNQGDAPIKNALEMTNRLNNDS